MFDDAEKKIARLMAESTTSGESKADLGKIKVKGQGHFIALGEVNVTINVHQMRFEEGQTPAPAVPMAKVNPTEEALEYIRQTILTKCEELGDPLLYRPFILSLFKTDRLEDLASAQLARLECWLGIRSI